MITEPTETVPQLSGHSIPDRRSEPPFHESQQDKSTRKKLHCSRKLTIAGIVFALLLLSASFLSEEVRTSILYPAIAYLIFEGIEKVIEGLDFSILDQLLPRKRP